MNIDLKDYILIRPDYIIEKKGLSTFYDIEVEEDHSFFIFSEEKETLILTHNCDGHHITALLVNLFYKWFPWIIERKMLHFLETPLVSTGEKSKTYFYSIQDFKDASAKKKMSSVRYLKGLGSLSLDDWEFVMKNKKITNIIKDKKSGQMLEMAFGKESGPRKIWLSSFNK
jgi:DNA gyrase/topoisomerase IV subunit B